MIFDVCRLFFLYPHIKHIDLTSDQIFAFMDKFIGEKNLFMLI